MMDALEDRLTALGAFTRVAAAVSFAELQNSGRVPQAHQLPAAFVVPMDETAGGQRHASGAHRQQLSQTVGVVLIVGARNDARGERALDQVKPLADRVRDHLIGWPPAPDAAPLAYRRGRVAGFQQGAVFWLAEFTTTQLLRTTDPGGTP